MLGAALRTLTPLIVLLACTQANAVALASDGDGAGVRSALVLIVCGNAAAPVYATGVIVGSDGVHSTVVTNLAVTAASCYPARVVVADDPKHDYPAKRLRIDLQQHGALMQKADTFVAFSIERATAHVAQLAATPPAAGTPLTVIAYPTNDEGSMPTGREAAPWAGRGTAVSNDSLFTHADLPRRFGMGAVVVDAASGAIVGVVAGTGVEPLWGPHDVPPPTRRDDVTQGAVIAEVAAAMNLPLGPAAPATMRANVERARTIGAIRRYAFIVMRRDTQFFRGAYVSDGFAVALGSNRSGTVLATFVDPKAIANDLVAVPDESGDLRKAQPVLLGHDDVTGVTFVLVAAMNAAAPFEQLPRIGAAIVVPVLHVCVWNQTVGTLDDCTVSLQSYDFAVPGPQDPINQLAFTLGVHGTGAPIVDASSGRVIGVFNGGDVTAANLRHALASVAPGVALDLRP